MGKSLKALQLDRYRARVRANNGPLRTDAGPVRQKIGELLGAGATYQSIAEAAGLCTSTVDRLHKSRNKTVILSTWDAVMGIESVPLGFWLDPTGTQRRLQALAWLGYPFAEVDRRIGRSKCKSQMILQNTRVSRPVRDAVAAVYDELSCTPNVSGEHFERMVITQARARARRNGWAPPAAWDDIDDPNEKPKGVQREAA